MEQINIFLYWAELKLPANETVPLFNSSAQQLSEMGERTVAKIIYQRAVDLAVKTSESSERSSASASAVFVVKNKVQAIYGIASCEIKDLLELDPSVKYPNTLKHLLASLRQIQRAMDLILSIEDAGEFQATSCICCCVFSHIHLTLEQPLLIHATPSLA